MANRQNTKAGISPEFYATLDVGDTRQRIAFAGVREMVTKYCGGANKALDYGCGAGRSTRVLKEMGLGEVVGGDINQEMLQKAVEKRIPGTSYLQIKSGQLPFKDCMFDLVFSGLVILEISKAREIRKILKELKRVTTDQGTVIILTCTKEGYLTDSDHFEVMLTPEQQANIKDGDPVPIRVRDTGQVFTDYYWSN